MFRTKLVLMLTVATTGCATVSVAQVSPPAVAVAVRMDTVPAVPPSVDDAPMFVLTPLNTRLEISVKRRRLLVIAGRDTLRRARVAVASGRDLSYAGRTWRFATPRGQLRLKGKRTDPVWVPPDWHYAEVAKQHNLKLAHFHPGVRLRNGDRLVSRDSVIGVHPKGDTAFLALPVHEHIVFDATLFIPPISTLNRRLHGELGRYALDLGDGYMLHGSADPSSIGSDTTHGCIRLADGDLTWLYTYVPVGVMVVVR